MDVLQTLIAFLVVSAIAIWVVVFVLRAFVAVKSPAGASRCRFCGSKLKMVGMKYATICASCGRDQTEPDSAPSA